MYNLRKYCILLILTVLSVCTFSSCMYGPKASDRNFTIEELLLKEDDLPEVWMLSASPEKPLQVDGEIFASDSIVAHFLTAKNVRESLLHKVYRFRYIGTAGKEFRKKRDMYIKKFPPSSAIPYQSKCAIQTYVRYWRLPEAYYRKSKDKRENKEKGTCYVYMAVYEEFLFIIHVFEYGSMSNAQFKKAIDILDERITAYLKETK